MAELPIPFPLNGISETTSYEAQPPGTTVDARNVRAFDGATGRARGAQREGMSRLSNDRLSGDGKVQAITTVTYDERQTTYTERNSAPVGNLMEWEKSVGDVRTLAVDLRGDVFAIEGNAKLVKYNSSGVKQYEFVLPIPTQNQIIRALTLDDLGNIYVACSEGTTGQAKAWIRSYYPNVDTVLALRWSIEVGGWIQRMEIINDTLYAAVNFTDTGRSKIIGYEFIFGGAPQVAREFSVPYPVNDLTVNSIGEFITAHEAQTNRSYGPNPSGTTHIVPPDALRWDPTKLDRWDERKWAWLSGGTIKQQFGYEAIQDGDDVDVWEDLLGSGGISMVRGSDATDLSPKYIKSGLAGHPGLRFGGDRYRLQSSGSKSLLPGALPGETNDQAYLLVIVAKPTNVDSTPQALLYQDSSLFGGSVISGQSPAWGRYWYGENPGTAPDYYAPAVLNDGPEVVPVGPERFDTIVCVNGVAGQKKTIPVDTSSALGLFAAYDSSSQQGVNRTRVGYRLLTHDKVLDVATSTTYYIGRADNSSTGPSLFNIKSAIGDTTQVFPWPSPLNLEITDYSAFTQSGGSVSVMGEFAGNIKEGDSVAYPNGQYTDPKNASGKYWSGSPTDPLNPIILTLLVDNERCGAGNNVSLFRVNGMPLAQWKSVRHASQGKPVVMGKVKYSDSSRLESLITGDAAKPYYYAPSLVTHFLGLDAEVYEVFVLREYVDNQVKKVCTFPKYDASLANPASYNSNASGTNPTYDVASDSEIERIEAYFAWKYGIAHLLDKGTGSANSNPSWSSTEGVTEYAHPYGLSTQPGCVQSPPNESDKGDDTKDKTLWTNSSAMMAKWNEQRGPRWVYAGLGLGYAVRSDGDNLWSVGPKDGNGKTVKLWNDAGSSVTETAGAVVYAATDGLPSEYNYKYPITLVDRFSQFWVPSSWDSEIRHSSVRVYKAPTSGSVLQERLVYSTDGNDAKDGRAVAVDNVARNYDGNPTTIQLPEYFVVGTTEAGVTGSATIQYCDPISATVDQNASSRIVVWLGAAGGVLRRFTNGVVQAVTGGDGLDPNAKIIQMVSAYQKVYITDGTIYKVYDPKTNTATEWTAGASGRIPEGCRLMTFWRGRMVLARGPDDPFNWHMSAAGDPDDWDLFPPDGPLETQAISGNNSEVGGNHDIINAIIPYDRERLIFGGDHTIHMMWGDPMAGGVITMLSDATGIAYGSGHAKDSQGILYFFGSRGGVYAISPGGAADRISNHPQKISSQTIDRRLEKVNFDTHYVTMAWDDVNQKLHVYQMPFALNTEQMEHWVWEKRTQSWWIDTFASLDLEPTAVFLMDGDEPDDRIIAVGCQDGYVRYPDRDATSDDGYPIDSYVVIGPLFTGTDKVRIRNPKINLSNDQGGCWLEMSSSDTADSIGDPVHRVRLLPGQNRRAMIGVRGAYCWLKLRSAANGFRWAYESGSVEAIPAGRRIAP